MAWSQECKMTHATIISRVCSPPSPCPLKLPREDGSAGWLFSGALSEVSLWQTRKWDVCRGMHDMMGVWSTLNDRSVTPWQHKQSDDHGKRRTPADIQSVMWADSDQVPHGNNTTTARRGSADRHEREWRLWYVLNVYRTEHFPKCTAENRRLSCIMTLIGV